MPRIPGKPAVTATTPDDDVVVPDLNPTGLSTESAIALAVTIPDEPDSVVPDLEADVPFPKDFGSHIVSVDDILPSDDNPRADLELDDEFVASIAEHGILQPLLLTPNGEGFDIVAGHRRYAAAVKVGLPSVPAVLTAAVGQGAEVLRLVENLQRRDLTPVDEARAYHRLVKVHGLSQADVATQVGRNQGHVSKRLKMLTLGEEGLEQVLNGNLSVELAVDLARMPAGVRADIIDGIQRGNRAEALIEGAALKLADLAERGALLKQLKADKVPFWDKTVEGGALPEGAEIVYQVAGHETCPNRFVVVETHKSWDSTGKRTWIREYCTDAEAHRTARQAAADTAESSPRGGRAEQKARELTDAEKANRARLDVLGNLEQARQDAVETVLKGKLPRDTAETIARILVTGIDPGVYEVQLASLPTAWEEAIVGKGLAKEALRSAANGDILTKFALAVALATAEAELVAALEDMPAVVGDDGPKYANVINRGMVQAYTSWLVARGYKLYTFEQAAAGEQLPEGWDHVADAFKQAAAAAE
jgi:ParB/RepB/Spo0J family partition protein